MYKNLENVEQRVQTDSTDEQAGVNICHLHMAQSNFLKRWLVLHIIIAPDKALFSTEKY